jgi:hypothetical protein
MADDLLRQSSIQIGNGYRPDVRRRKAGVVSDRLVQAMNPEALCD